MILESFDAKLKLVGEDKILDSIAKNSFLYNHIPGIKLSKSELSVDATLKIDIGKFNIGMTYPNLYYSNDVLNEKDIIALSEYVLERARQERGKYTIHSNTILTSYGSVVLFGPHHIGKTTLSLLIAKQMNGIVIANERSVIEPNNKTISGDIKNITINKYSEEILEKYSITQNNIFKYVGKGKDKITCFIHPLITDKEHKMIRYGVDAAIWDIIAETDIFIRGINRRVRKIDGFYSLPSLDTDNLANRRFEDISKLLAEVPCYTIKGTFNSIPKTLENYLKK